MATSRFKNFKKTIENNNGTLDVGKSLINSSTKENLLNTYDDVVMIELDNLIASEMNDDISMDGIEELAESIKLTQLYNPISVVQTNTFGVFEIIAGHRRTKAFEYLYQTSGDDKYKAIPAFIIDIAKYDMPISNELKLKYAHATTNVEKRQDTEKDTLVYIKNLTEVYDELKKSGMELGKKRDFIGERLSMSGRQVQKYVNIDNNLEEELKEKFYQGEMSVNVADEMSRVTPEKQVEIFEESQNENRDEKVIPEKIKRQDYFADTKKALKKVYFNSFQIGEIEHKKRMELIKKKNELNDIIKELDLLLDEI